MTPQRRPSGLNLLGSIAASNAMTLGRREFLGRVGLAGAGFLLGAGLLRDANAMAAFVRLRAGQGVPAAALAPHRYLEFAEPGADLRGVTAGFDARPWRIRIEGLVERPRELDLGDLVGRMPIEERLVRHCVAATTALPWTGFALSALVRWVRPLPAARYLRVVSFVRPDLAANQRRATCYPWPYREGLALDEALDPRAFVATGLCGRGLPAMRGAPLRLVLPWKRGYKSAKGIVRFEFTGRPPGTFWGELAPLAHNFAGNAGPLAART